ncbi:MAG: tRNA-dihydrouridine synthase C [Porticoccus sp.]|jgi:tRNA-dihydrouridine synthase C
MEGVTDHLMRKLLCQQGGVSRCVTEFVRITNTLLPPKLYYRCVPELLAGAVTANNIPVYVQLLGSDAACLADNAARAAELGAVGIDLNFGCPAKTVNRHKGGAIMLQEPDNVGKAVAAVRNAVPKHIPVTAKMRLGYLDKTLYTDNAQAINDAGANELCVHARTKSEAYKPPAHWEYLAKIREQVTIPVIANGDIWSLEDYKICRAITGCEHVMIGRGLLANPKLAFEITQYNQSGVLLESNWQDIVPLLLAFQTDRNAHYPARFAGDRLKKWLHYLSMQFDEAEVLFNRIRRLREPDELQLCLEQAA